MRQLRRTRSLVAVPATALVAVALVACSSPTDRAEDALRDQGISADLDDPSNIEIEGTDGGVTTGKLPKDFPTDEVPVVDGEILAGTFTNNPQTWNVTIRVGDPGGDKTAAYDDAEATLVDAGLETVTPKADNGTSIGGQYSSDSWSVVLAVTDSNGIVVNYTVSPK